MTGQCHEQAQTRQVFGSCGGASQCWLPGSSSWWVQAMRLPRQRLLGGPVSVCLSVYINLRTKFTQTYLSVYSISIHLLKLSLVIGCQNGIMCKFCHLCDAGEKMLGLPYSWALCGQLPPSQSTCADGTVTGLHFPENVFWKF